jgi:hypothetical protein
MAFKKAIKKVEPLPEEVLPPVVKEKRSETPFNPPVKSDSLCVHDGCFEGKAPGQTHVCAKHIRSN